MSKKAIDHTAESFKENAAKEKLFAAEQHISVVRMLVIAINSIIYYLFIDRADSIPWLADFIVASAGIYSVFVWYFKPYKRFSALRSSFFTFMTDGALIFTWIIATGMIESPFYLLWCLSIIAVAQRYTFRETILTSLIYTVLYLIIVTLDERTFYSDAELIARLAYIPVTGLLGAYFAKEISDQIQDKLKARKAGLEAQKAEREANRLLDKLGQEIQEKIKAESRLQRAQNQLEKRVEERTQELQKLNRELKNQVAERKRIQQIQKETLEKMADINQELESFAYITSHDLKAPLRGISTIADWLHDDYVDQLDEDGRIKLRLLKQRVQKMYELIEGILLYSRVGRSEDKKEMVDTNEVVREVLELTNPPPSFKVVVEPGMPEIKSNKTLITQIFENLVSNAIKYTNRQNGEIRIGAHEKGSDWEFYVQDNGIGIEEKHHKRIFDMFQTLGSDEGAENTGIGLAVVKKVINKLGGKIRVESEPGKGSKFIFTLPKTTGQILRKYGT